MYSVGFIDVIVFEEMAPADAKSVSPISLFLSHSTCQLWLCLTTKWFNSAHLDGSSRAIFLASLVGGSSQSDQINSCMRI